MRPVHACCPAARHALKATKLRSHRDSYRWRIIGTEFYPIYCPWCAVELEVCRKREYGTGPRLVPPPASPAAPTDAPNPGPFTDPWVP
jgi:hypothetical protein